MYWHVCRKPPGRCGSERFGDSFGPHSSGSSGCGSPVRPVPELCGFPGCLGFQVFRSGISRISRISGISEMNFLDVCEFWHFQDLRFSLISRFNRFHCNSSCQGCGSDRFSSQRFGSSDSGSFRGLPAINILEITLTFHYCADHTFW